MAWVSKDDVDTWFTYQAPTHEGVEKIRAIREKARELAHVIRQHAPQCADQSSAIRKLRECVMVASAAVVLDRSKARAVGAET